MAQWVSEIPLTLYDFFDGLEMSAQFVFPDVGTGTGILTMSRGNM